MKTFTWMKFSEGYQLAVQTQNLYLWYMRAHDYNPNHTLADYDMWQGNWELIDGYPYSMSPSESAKHQRFASKLHVQFVLSLSKIKGCSNNCEVLYELDWRINNNTVVRPDLVVVCNLTDNFITKPPILIVELLSDATAFKDRHLKYELYQEQGVPYYIIIDPEMRKHNIYVLSVGSYVELNDTKSFTIAENCTLELDIAQVLKEVYNRI